MRPLADLGDGQRGGVGTSAPSDVRDFCPICFPCDRDFACGDSIPTDVNGLVKYTSIGPDGVGHADFYEIAVHRQSPCIQVLQCLQAR